MGTFAVAGAADVDRAVKAASAAFRDGPWGALCRRGGTAADEVGREIAEHADRIATIGDQGRTASSSRRCGRRRASRRTGSITSAASPTRSKAPSSRSIGRPSSTTRCASAHGVVGVITPWDSPTFIAIMSLAPAMAAGNTIVMKPSEITSASSIELARLAEGPASRRASSTWSPAFARRAGARRSPAGGEGVLHRQRRRGARDRRARAAPGQLHARARRQSPNIVFSDANLDQAEAGVLAGIFAAAGQTCVAGRVPTSRNRSTTGSSERIVRRAQQITIGDPMLATAQMGPVATKMQLEKDESMVRAR